MTGESRQRVVRCLGVVAWGMTVPTASGQEDQPAQAAAAIEVVELRDATTRVYKLVRAVENEGLDAQEVAGAEGWPNLIEKGAGLCFPDAAGNWTPANPTWIQGFSESTVEQAAYSLRAGRTPAEGVVYEVAGQTLRLAPAGVFLWDGTNETSAMVAVGTSNSVVDPAQPQKISYAGALGPDIDLEYEASPAGFHQNLLIKSLPLPPAEMQAELTFILVRTHINLGELLATGLTVTVHGDPVEVASLSMQEWTSTGHIALESPEGPILWFADSVVLCADGSAHIAEKRLQFDPASGSWLLEERLPLKALDGKERFPVLWDYVLRSGALTAHEVWKSGDTIWLSDDLTVPAPWTLTIEPDCTVKLNGGKELVVSTGKVVAKGQPYRPITFTSAQDKLSGELICKTDSPGCIPTDPCVAPECPVGCRPVGFLTGLPKRCLVINAGSDPNWEVEFCHFNQTTLSSLTVAADSARTCSGSSCPTNIKHCVFRAAASSSYGLQITARGAGSHGVNVENNLFVNDVGATFPAIGVLPGTPAPAGFSYTFRNNTLESWGSGIYMSSGAGSYASIKQNIFSKVSLPNYISSSISTAWQRNGYYQSPVTSSEYNAITLYTNPFDTVTAPRIGLYYLNNVSGGGGSLRKTGVESVQSVYGALYKQFEFQAPTLLHPGPTVTSLNLQPQYDYASGTEAVSIGFHAPRVDYFNDRNITVTGMQGTPLVVAADTVVALDTSQYASPYIYVHSSSVTLGGPDATSPWATFANARAVATICDAYHCGVLQLAKTLVTPHQDILSRHDRISIGQSLGSGLAQVRRCRFLWLGYGWDPPGSPTAALTMSPAPYSAGSFVRDVELYNCPKALYYADQNGPVPITNALFYGCGKPTLLTFQAQPAVVFERGDARLDFCTFDACPLAISQPGTAGVGHLVTVRNSIFSESSIAFQVVLDSAREDHNAYWSVSTPISWVNTQDLPVGLGSISPRSYQLGNAPNEIPFDRTPSLERSLWFLKGRYGQEALPAGSVALEDAGAGISSDWQLSTGSTNRRGVPDEGPADLGYHVFDFADTDADGMPDVWEVFFGLNPTSAADAVLDPDGDQLLNLAEFQQGTKPNGTNASDTDLDTRVDGGLTGETVVWTFDWSTDKTQAELTVDPLRKAEHFFGANVADFKGTANQRGGPIQTTFAPTQVSVEWQTPAATQSGDKLWLRASNATAFTPFTASSGTQHQATVSFLQPDTLYFMKGESIPSAPGRVFGFYTQLDSALTPFVTAPYLQNPRYDSQAGTSEVSILWRTSSASGTHRVGYRPAGFNTAPWPMWVTDTTGTQDHEVRLVGLTPGGSYFYRVESQGAQSQEFRLRAARSNPAKVVVAVHGDNRAEAASEFSFAHTRIAETILSSAQAPDLDFAVSLGEVYANGMGPYYNHLWWPARDLMATVPLFVAPGELERAGDVPLVNFARLFAYPSHGVPGKEAFPFFSYDYGPCHFIVLDAGTLTFNALTHEGGPGLDTQHEWLLEDLRQATSRVPRPWICAFIHTPVATDTQQVRWSNPAVERARLGTGTTLEAFGVDVVFQGHSHAYERFKYSFTDATATANVHDDFGVHYIVSGGGGAEPHDVLLSTPTPGAAGRKRGLSAYNACILSATSSTLEVKAYEIGSPQLLDVLTLTQPWPHPRRVLVGKYEVPVDNAFKWKVFPTGVPSAGWNALVFDDSSWSTVTVGGELGINDGDEAFTVAPLQSAYYFRRRFSLNAGDIAAGDVVELRVVVDDGAEVYLQGGNLTTPVLATSVPLMARSTYQEREWHFLRVTSLDASSPPGDYLLSVRLSQAEAPGATVDASFWAELVVKRAAP